MAEHILKALSPHTIKPSIVKVNPTSPKTMTLNIVVRLLTNGPIITPTKRDSMARLRNSLSISKKDKNHALIRVMKTFGSNYLIREAEL